MRHMEIEDSNVRDMVLNLKYLMRTYKGINREIVSAKNRWKSFDLGEEKYSDIIQQFESVKNKIARKIEKELPFWPIWYEWLKNVPGIGAVIGAELILLYYYRFQAICNHCGGVLEKSHDDNGNGSRAFVCMDCGKKAKGQGNLKYKIEIRDFPKISNWWSFMGKAIGDDGRIKKRKKGVKINHSNAGRALCYQIGEQFEKKKSDHDYRAFYDRQKKKRERTHPKATKGLRQNMVKNEVEKLFLAHFWQVARTLDGLEVTQPYAGTILGHTNILEPFFT